MRMRSRVMAMNAAQSFLTSVNQSLSGAGKTSTLQKHPKLHLFPTSKAISCFDLPSASSHSSSHSASKCYSSFLHDTSSRVSLPNICSVRSNRRSFFAFHSFACSYQPLEYTVISENVFSRTTYQSFCTTDKIHCLVNSGERVVKSKNIRKSEKSKRRKTRISLSREPTPPTFEQEPSSSLTSSEKMGACENPMLRSFSILPSDPETFSKSALDLTHHELIAKDFESIAIASESFSNSIGLPAAAVGVASDQDLKKNDCGNGGIHLILGPMFAGKTTALIKRMKDAMREGKRVVIVKSCVDNRYAKSEIVSHDGERMQCMPVSSMADFRQIIGDVVYSQIDVIGIDEAQFIKDLESFCINAADNDNKTIIAAGLDGDFLRRKFGSLVDLVPVSETVTKLYSRCEVCGGKAVFTLRKSHDLETNIVGGSDLYMPVCREHYVAGQFAIRTARILVGDQDSPLDDKLLDLESAVSNKDSA